MRFLYDISQEISAFTHPIDVDWDNVTLELAQIPKVNNILTIAGVKDEESWIGMPLIDRFDCVASEAKR
jgi:hypothetical protein